MSIPKSHDKELLLILLSMMLNNIFDFIFKSRSISVNRTQIGICLSQVLTQLSSLGSLYVRT